MRGAIGPDRTHTVAAALRQRIRDLAEIVAAESDY
jgi:hypothetical protein